VAIVNEDLLKLLIANIFLVPKLSLGNPIAGQAPAWREKHLFIAAGGPSRSLGEIDVPKQELGNEGR